VSFFRYIDRDGRIIQLCQHHIEKVYQKSRYHFFSFMGSERGRLNEADLFEYKGKEVGMTMEQYIKNGVFSLAFFQDFLDDAGQYGVSKRVIGSYKREVFNNYSHIVDYKYRCPDQPGYRKCCGGGVEKIQRDYLPELVKILVHMPGVIRVHCPTPSQVLGWGVIGRGQSRRAGRRRRRKNVRLDLPD